MMQTEGKPCPMISGTTMQIKVPGPLLPSTTIWAAQTVGDYLTARDPGVGRVGSL